MLPGNQALFGFQLIAVFNARFETDLLASEQYLHSAAILAVVLSIAPIMAPAAYHRQAERGLISRYFTDRTFGSERSYYQKDRNRSMLPRFQPVSTTWFAGRAS